MRIGTTNSYGRSSMSGKRLSTAESVVHRSAVRLPGLSVDRHRSPVTAPRSAEDRARFIRSTAADLDVGPELAERLLMLSESARAHAAGSGPDDRRRQDLLGLLLDDELCRHGWWVAAVEGEPLWRSLLHAARPPEDVGPAVLLVAALARRGAAESALALITDVIRPREFRRSAIEIAVDLAEDAGRPSLAWELVVRLGDADRADTWDPLRCVLGCSARGPCPRSRLIGATHARWLRHRIHRWLRRPWSGCDPAVPEGRDGERRMSEAESFTRAVRAYSIARATALPAGERGLLRRWSLSERREFTVVESSPFEAVILDGGQRHVAGWDTMTPTDAVSGQRISGWLLPTLMPREWLLVRSAATPIWRTR